VKRLVLVVILAGAALAAMLGYASNRREQSYRTLIEQGDAALAQGESVTAVEAFTVAIALKPDSMLGYLKRGEAYRQYGDFETALKDLRTASRLDSSATRPLELLGDVQHALGRYDRAAAHFDQYVKIDDRSPRVLYKLALSKFHAGNPAGAVESLHAATRIEERFPEAHYLLGLCFQTLKRPDLARRSLNRAVELSPALLEAREELAALHRRTSRTDEHLSQLDMVRALDDESPPRHIALGLAYAEAGQLDRAVTVLGGAVERFPTHAYAYVALGRVWLDLSQNRGDAVALQKALEALQRGAATEPSSEALMLLGRAWLLAEQPGRAAPLLVDATTKKPLEPLAFLYLAEAAERTGDVAAARRALLDYHALEGDPPDPRRRARMFDRVATLSVRMGEPQAAIGWWQRAAAAAPGEVDAAFLVRLADAHWRAGDTTAARDTLAKALEKEPGHRPARALLRRINSGV
jgi:tetratricopeptide (TPR) repeat protein